MKSKKIIVPACVLATSFLSACGNDSLSEKPNNQNDDNAVKYQKEYSLVDNSNCDVYVSIIRYI